MRGNHLEINGKVFPLEDKLSLQLNSPFSDREQFKNSFTYPANITPSNELLNELGNPHLLQQPERIEKVDGARLLSDGVAIVDGALFLNKLRRNLNSGKVSIESFVGNGQANYASKIGDKTLRDLKLGGVIEIPGTYTFEPNDWGSYIFSSGNATTEWATDVVLNGHELVCFPSIRNKQLTVGKSLTYGIMNFWDDANNTLRMPTETEVQAAHDNYINDIEFHSILPIAIVPCYYYHQVLKACFSEFGYELSGELMDDEDFKKIYLLNSTGIVKPKFYTWSSGAGLYCGRYEEMTTWIDPKNHLPSMRIQDFVTDFLQHFNLQAIFKGRNVELRKSKLKKPGKDYTPFLAPDVEIEDVATGVKIEYEYPEDYEYESIGLNKAKEKITSVTEQLDKGASIGPDGTYALIKMYNKLAVIVNGNATDGAIDNLIPYESGTGAIISLKVVPAIMRETHYGDPELAVDCYLPTVDYKPFELYGQWIENDVYTGPPGAITFFETAAQPSWRRVAPEYVDIPSQILFYHGLLNDIGPDKFPFSSHGGYSPSDTTPLTQWHLGIHGKEGIVSYFYSDFMPVFNTRQKTIFSLNLPIHEIKDFDHGLSAVIYGGKYYVAIVKTELPIRSAVSFECYEIRD